MKSRKTGLFGKLARRKSLARKKKRQNVRHLQFVEQLESRQLMAGLLTADTVAATGKFISAEAREETVAYMRSLATGGVRQAAEGFSNSTQAIQEVEPNNATIFAQFLPLGFGPAGFSGVDYTGVMSGFSDEEYVAFDLQSGDILDARLVGGTGRPGTLTLFDSRVRELATSTVASSFGISYPIQNPLTAVGTNAGTGIAAFNYVIANTGRYLFRIADVATTATGLASYVASFRVYRSSYESAVAGNQQVLFLDFNGAFVPNSLIPAGAASGTARLQPLSSSLAGYGLQVSDEGAFIDALTRRIQSKFDFVRANGRNQNFGVQILNSKDHADPWGLPNVTRVIFGQSGTDIGLAANSLFGIAQGIDPGNYAHEETVLVFHDVHQLTTSAVPVNANVRRLEMIAESIAVTAAHEVGHVLGALHQQALNGVNTIMDQVPTNAGTDAGVGRDNFFGTADDEPLQFISDTYANTSATPFLGGGVNDSLNIISYALTTGQQGGRSEGFVYNDRNLNLRRDSGEPGLAGWTVFADLNGDRLFTSNEPSTSSRGDGSYSLLLSPGTYNIRSMPASGFRSVAPASGTHSVTVATNQVVTGRDFGFEQLDLRVTGFKWDDLNGDGIAQPAEPRIPGVWIYIDTDGDKRIDIGEPSTRTGADGTYTFNFPGPGTYSIREVIEPGFIQSLPGAIVRTSPDGRLVTGDFGYTLTLTGNPTIDNSNIAGLNFGNRSVVDYGDAPSTYGTLKVNAGAAHGFVSGLMLGSNWDAEGDGQPSAGANGDDLAGTLDANNVVVDDEDGVILARPLVRGRNDNTFLVTLTNATGTSAYLHGWMDFNQDGDFGDSSEQIFSNVSLATGSHALSFAAPGSAVLGTTIARFRLSNEQNLGPAGRANSGEVEDHIFNVVNSLDLAVDDTFSVERNSILNTLDITANDFKLPGETLTIVRAGPSSAGGIVTIVPGGLLQYTPPNGFIGQDVFTYDIRNSLGQTDQANVVVNVTAVFNKPIAIDDTFDVATNSVSIPLNVLANDIQGRAGAITIFSVTQPTKGGQVSIATGGQSLRYTPARNLGDTEQFTYSIADSAGNIANATVTVHLLPGDRLDDDVSIKLVATDLQGNVISAIPQGQQFKIDVLVDDNRNDRGQFIPTPGVFSAYLDLLYNLQLVSTVPSAVPGGRFDFAVSFFNDYTNFTLGDASVPGLINDLGAFSNRNNLSFPNFVKMASVTFTARSPGIAQFLADPADDPPETDVTLFSNPNTAVPISKVQYLGTTLEIVGDSVEFPRAIDDSFANPVPLNAFNHPLNVLANDRRGSTGVIQLVSTSGAQNGIAAIFDNGTSAPGDDIIRYTPNSGFSGTDQFSYTIQDARGVQSSAQVTVQIGAAADNDEASLRLDVTNLNGQPLGSSSVKVGEQFQLRGYIQDIRNPFGSNRGIFAAYEDVLYSSNLVSPVASTTNPLGFQVQFGPNYSRIQSGDIRTPGIINEIGAVQIDNNNQPLGTGEQLLFVVTFTANAIGDANFNADPADIKPLHDTLTFEPVAAVPFDRIRYGFDTVKIIAGSGGAGGEGNTNMANPLDVNADGFVSPIDALSVINSLNVGGSRKLAASGEGEDSSRLYIDVNADGAVSPIDVLMIVNHLNTRSLGSAEGEGLDQLSGAVPTPAANSASSSPTSAPPSELALLQDESADLSSSSTTPSVVASHPNLLAPVIEVDDDNSDLESILDQLAPDIDLGWKRDV